MFFNPVKRFLYKIPYIYIYNIQNIKIYKVKVKVLPTTAHEGPEGE